MASTFWVHHPHPPQLNLRDNWSVKKERDLSGECILQEDMSGCGFLVVCFLHWSGWGVEGRGVTNLRPQTCPVFPGNLSGVLMKESVVALSTMSYISLRTTTLVRTPDAFFFFVFYPDKNSSSQVLFSFCSVCNSVFCSLAPFVLSVLWCYSLFFSRYCPKYCFSAGIVQMSN